MSWCIKHLKADIIKNKSFIIIQSFINLGNVYAVVFLCLTMLAKGSSASPTPDTNPFRLQLSYATGMVLMHVRYHANF